MTFNCGASGNHARRRFARGAARGGAEGKDEGKETPLAASPDNTESTNVTVAIATPIASRNRCPFIASGWL